MEIVAENINDASESRFESVISRPHYTISLVFSLKWMKLYTWSVKQYSMFQLAAQDDLYFILSMLGKISADDTLKYFSYLFSELGFDILCNLLPDETVCIRC